MGFLGGLFGFFEVGFFWVGFLLPTLVEGHHCERPAVGSPHLPVLGVQPEETVRGASGEDDEGHGELDEGGADAAGDAEPYAG